MAPLAPAFLAVLAATQADDGNPNDDQLIPLTCNEIRRLFTGLCQQPPAPSCAGHHGDAAINTPREPAITGNEPSNSHDHEASLED